jgi:hypothetical protein
VVIEPEGTQDEGTIEEVMRGEVNQEEGMIEVMRGEVNQEEEMKAGEMSQ